MRDKIDEIQQQSRSKAVEIVGFPETNGESGTCVVQKIAEKVGVPVRPEQIKSVERLPTLNKPSPLLVIFRDQKGVPSYISKKSKSEG